jgi:putative inorganic carbon (HCO3(-)) transporter
MADFSLESAAALRMRCRGASRDGGRPRTQLMQPPKLTTQYPTSSTLSTLLFAVLVASWWLEVGLRITWLGAIRFEFLLAGLLSLIALVHRPSAPRRSQPNANRDILWAIVMLLVVQGLSLPLAVDFVVAWNAYFNRLVKYAILGVVISQYVISPVTLRVYLFASFVAFLKIGEEAFLGKITGNMVWENQGVPRLHGTAGSMFGHPNSLSGKTVSVLPFIWYLFPTVKARWVKLLVLVEVVFAINIIVFTASRTGYLTVIASALILAAFSKRRRFRAFAFAVAVAVVAVIFVPQEYKERFSSAFTLEEKEGHSAETRKGLFFDSLTTFTHHPLGVGPECFPQYQALEGRNAQETHNLYTQVLAETGIQGFICFAALLYVVLRKAGRTRRGLAAIIEHLESHRSRAPPEARALIDAELQTNRLLFATTTAVVVFTLVRLVLGVFGHDLFEIYWWIAAGLTMALHNMSVIAEKRCTELAGAPAGEPLGALRGQPTLARRRMAPKRRANG